jgi:hypothetical protein
LNQITVHLTGELWRQAALAKSLAAGYWIDPAATNAFSTNLTARLPMLDVAFAANPAATNPIPFDGTVSLNQLSIGTTNQPIAAWPPGAAFWLSWQMTDATGKGQGLAIDNLVFSAAATQVGPLAQLSILQSVTNVIVSWPATLSGYQLQGNLDLGTPGGWSSVSQPVIVSNGLNSVAIPIGPSSQFFRLKQ